jgi:hypothetical protein
VNNQIKILDSDIKISRSNIKKFEKDFDVTIDEVFEKEGLHINYDKFGNICQVLPGSVNIRFFERLSKYINNYSYLISIDSQSNILCYAFYKGAMVFVPMTPQIYMTHIKNPTDMKISEAVSEGLRILTCYDIADIKAFIGAITITVKDMPMSIDLARLIELGWSQKRDAPGIFVKNL